MKQKDSNTKWIIEAFIITFILSGIISYISQNGIANLNVIPAIIILIIVVFLGIFFDVVGIAVTVANEEHFHAKATKKAEGAKSSLNLIKNASKVANICADVIGDICGVISGNSNILNNKDIFNENDIIIVLMKAYSKEKIATAFFYY